MTTQEITQYFQYHNLNMKLLKIGFEQIKAQIKIHYKTKNKSNNYVYQLDDSNSEKIAAKKVAKSLSRILSGIQVSWAEESIKRLLYEGNLLTDNQREYLLTRPALDQKWYKTLHVVFCIAYDLVPASDETCKNVKVERERRNLGDELVNRYLELKDIITNQLVPNIWVRNKVQHGEWEFVFNDTVFSQDYTDKLNKENIVTTNSRFNLVNAVYQMLVDLGRFKSDSFALDSITTPFEYFYDDYMFKIKSEVVKINHPNLESYISTIVERKIRGDLHHP